MYRQVNEGPSRIPPWGVGVRFPELMCRESWPALSAPGRPAVGSQDPLSQGSVALPTHHGQDFLGCEGPESSRAAGGHFQRGSGGGGRMVSALQEGTP